MNPKPRSFQRQAVPVTRSPVPSPILPRVGERLGPRRGERPRGGDRERPRGGLRSSRGGEREREAMVLAPALPQSSFSASRRNVLIEVRRARARRRAAQGSRDSYRAVL